MKNISGFLLVICLVISVPCASSEKASHSGREAETLESLSNGFVNPPASSRPGAFWPWLNGDVTKESITSDMEEMKDKGMSGAEIWDIEARYNPDGAFGIGPEISGR